VVSFGSKKGSIFMKEYQHWNIHKINKTDNGELIVSVELRDKEYNTFELNFKWDGCVNLWKRYNGYTNDSEFSKDVEENTDYMHICDLEEFVSQLQEVLVIAKDILGKEKYERDFTCNVRCDTDI